MSSSMGIRNKLKNRLKLVVNRKKIDVSDDIEPIRYRRNQANSSNVKYKDGKVSCKIDGVYHRNPPVYKEKQFNSDHDREHTSFYKKDVRERGRPPRNVELFDRKSLSEEGKYSRRGSGDFMKDKKNERTPRRKDPLHDSEHSTMVKEKSNRFRAVGYQTKLKTKHVDRKFSGTRNEDEGENSDRKYKRKLYGTRHKDEGENGFREKNSDRRIKSYRRTDKRDDNQLVSDVKTRHNDESLANRRVKMPRQKKGSNEESVITDEKYNRLGAVVVNSRSKKKDLDGSASNTRYMDGGQGIFTEKNSNIKFNSNKKTYQRDVSNQLVTRMSDAKNKHQARSLVNTSKKTLKGKKGSESDDDSTITSDLPKKRKRVIRIDPHDISNKRIDDSISTHVGTKTVENIEVSQNAQFRAIKPSSEILSFVEDNLLGRRRLIELRRAGYDINISSPLDNIPFPTSSERERMEENVFRNKLTFFAAAKVSSSLPPPDLPEIAFAGRSNVGKSSLLNSLTRQWGVVRTSDKPGLTQSINFFNLAQKLCLVDLPGYGFAYAKEEVKDAWEELVKEYVSTRAGLKRVCLLIDTKWGLKPRDYELINLMEGSETPYQIVLTKTDLVFPIDVARRAMQIQETLKKNKSVVKPVMMVSSTTGAGIRSLRSVVAKIARFVKL